MANSRSILPLSRPVAFTLAAISTLSLATHLYLCTGWPPYPSALLYGLQTFLRFFTIHSNILALFVALACLSKRPRFFSSPYVATAVVIYMVVVDLVYTAIISAVWQPVGLSWLVDVVLHYVLPPAYVLFWLLYIPKGLLRWYHVFPWLIYPLAYVVYDRICSAMNGSNPYPFLDTTKRGVPLVILFVLLLSILFLILSFAFVGVDRYLARRRTRQA